MDTGDKEVGAGVNGTIVILLGGRCILDGAAIRLTLTVRQRGENSSQAYTSGFPVGDIDRRRLPASSRAGRGEALLLSRS